MKKLMILGASVLQLPAILKAKEMGLTVIAVDMDADAVGMSYADTPLVISTIDIPRIVHEAKTQKIDGIMTLASDMPMRTVAAVAKEMGLVGISPETAVKATDKAEMRQALRAAGVPVPEFYKAGSKAEFDQIIGQMNGPVIVKPVDNSGSRGIFKVEDLSDSTMLEAAYEYSRQYSRSKDVVVEEFMQGPEVSVETLSVDGVCHVIQITDKITTGAPHFVEMGHTQPTRLPKEVAKKIAQVAVAANHAVGISDGPSHTEIIVTDDGPKVVEIGARLGGDCITTHLVPLSTGVDMVACCIHIALGEKPDIIRKFQKGSAIRYFQQKEGVIETITGVEQAGQLSGVQLVEIVHPAGTAITDITSSTARVGFLIAQGQDAADAAQKVEQGVKCIHIRMQGE